jgi:hypothetical protein
MCLATSLIAAKFIEDKKHNILYWTLGFDISTSSGWSPVRNIVIKHFNWFLIFTFAKNISILTIS